MKALIAGMFMVPMLLGTPAPTRVIDVLAVGHTLVTGYVCRSENDIVCVDGLCNQPGVAYWSIQVNGDYIHYNSESTLKPSDRVELQYQPQSAFVEEK